MWRHERDCQRSGLLADRMWRSHRDRADAATRVARAVSDPCVRKDNERPDRVRAASLGVSAERARGPREQDPHPYEGQRGSDDQIQGAMDERETGANNGCRPGHEQDESPSHDPPTPSPRLHPLRVAIDARPRYEETKTSRTSRGVDPSLSPTPCRIMVLWDCVLY